MAMHEVPVDLTKATIMAPHTDNGSAGWTTPGRIPSAAVEAAAIEWVGKRNWENCKPEWKIDYLTRAHAGLMAAAPHMLSRELEQTRLAHLDAVVNAKTADRLQAQVDAVMTLANELLRDGERADHYADHGQGQATGVREAIEGAETAHRIRAALRPTP